MGQHLLPTPQMEERAQAGLNCRGIRGGAEYSQSCLLETPLPPHAPQESKDAHCLQPPCCLYASGVRFWQAITLFSEVQLNPRLGRDHSHRSFPSDNVSGKQPKRTAARPALCRPRGQETGRAGHPLQNRAAGRAAWGEPSRTPAERGSGLGLLHRGCNAGSGKHSRDRHSAVRPF